MCINLNSFLKGEFFFQLAVTASNRLKVPTILLFIKFIGLLGPTNRKERLLKDLELEGKIFYDRLRSPVGKKIGGRGPAAIALEIAAELQSYFHNNKKY